MKKNFFSIVVLLLMTGMLAFLAAIAYLGTFTRYMADDYCESYITKAYSPLGAVINRYEDGQWRAANRYSNLLFVGVIEALLGKQNLQIMPVVLMFLWVIGLVYLVRQVRQVAGIQWHIYMDIFLGVALAFFSILEAPNRFQTFYWRSSMATHFVPLVFLNFLLAFLFSRTQSNKEASPSVWAVIGLFFASFMIGGFSEPPVTVIVVGSGLGLVYIWFFVTNEKRRTLLSLTASVFAGAVSALIVMAVSPAALNLSRDTPSFVEWLYRTAQYTYLFLIDAFKSLPLPILLSVVLPAALTFVIYREKERPNIINARVSRNIALALPFILILLIAAGFSTSAYGQSYPVARARFFAHYLITITLMFEGVLLGMWLSQVKGKFVSTVRFEYIAMLILLILAVYPFRASLQVIQEVPDYRERAEEWDARELQITTLIAQGETDLVVFQLDGVDGVKELDTFASHWVNLCAAKFYEVNSISAIPPK
jgi:hypothetical protein